MNSIQKEELLSELNAVLETMDVPRLRFTDLNWLDRNLAINNSQHPNFIQAQWLIRKIRNS